MNVNVEIKRITISIVYYDTELEVLHETLNSVRLAMDYLKTRESAASICFVIVDNGSARTVLLNLLEPLIKETEYCFKVIDSGGNVGFGAGHNLAIFKSASDYHLILNPDVLVDEHALYSALLYMENNKSVGLLTPLSENMEGEQQYLCKNYPSVFQLFLRGFIPYFIRKIFEKRLTAYEVRLDDEASILGKGIMVSGCFMFSRYSVLEKIGGFSPDYFVYFEDFDLSIRLGQQAQIAYVPQVRIIHRGGFAAGKGLDHVFMFIKSAFTFYRKNGWKWW